MDARALPQDRLVEGPRRSSMEEVTEWSRTLSQISFELAPVLGRKRVKFAGETVVNMDHETKTVTADKAEHRYDFLVVATGHMSANAAVQGLGPFDGPGHSLMWRPGPRSSDPSSRGSSPIPDPLWWGPHPGRAASGRSAYELAFELGHQLCFRRVRSVHRHVTGRLARREPEARPDALRRRGSRVPTM